MSEEKDFMFIGDGELTFLVYSLKEALTKKGFETDKCDIDTEHLKTIGRMPKFFVVDAEILLTHPKSRKYLYELCITFHRKVVLLGDRNTLKSLYDVSTGNVIGRVYERPLNNVEVVAGLEELIEEYDRSGLKKKILVIDDSPAFLRLISEWLEKDYNVNVCPSASAAFHMIETGQPDLILLDYEMPVCNGAQFLQMLHSEPQTAGIPVVFLTSKDDRQTVQSLIALKPQGYLLKNQSKDIIIKKLDEFFNRE